MLGTGAVTYPRYVVSRWVSGQLGATRRFACSAFRCGFLGRLLLFSIRPLHFYFAPKSETHPYLSCPEGSVHSLISRFELGGWNSFAPDEEGRKKGVSKCNFKLDDGNCASLLPVYYALLLLLFSFSFFREIQLESGDVENGRLYVCFGRSGTETSVFLLLDSPSLNKKGRIFRQRWKIRIRVRGKGLFNAMINL